MTKSLTLLLAAVAALAWGSSTAFAQSEPQAAVSVTAGAASGSSDTGVVLGGSVLFDATERLAIEATSAYLGRGEGADGFMFNGSLLVNLRRSTQRVVPYAAIGGGLYRVSFDLANPRFLGPVGTQFSPGSTVCASPGTGFGRGPGSGFGEGTGTCPATAAGYWGVGAVPDFYARRLGPLAFPAGGVAWEKADFTDPTLTVGGGIRFNLTDRVMVRPDVRALVIFADGKTHTIAVFGVNLGYRF